jgi:hypothetical protein
LHYTCQQDFFCKANEGLMEGAGLREAWFVQQNVRVVPYANARGTRCECLPHKLREHAGLQACGR